MQEMYHTVADIDLIVGLLAEIPSNQSLVGATLSCILGKYPCSVTKEQKYYIMPTVRLIDGSN
jgi:Animal haem peroxidase